MKDYIDKNAILSEIDDKIRKYTKRYEESDALHGMYWRGVLTCLNEIHDLIDSFKVGGQSEKINLKCSMIKDKKHKITYLI